MEPPQLGGWAKSHAMVPFVDVRNEGLALFFSSRDEKGRSSTGCASLDLSSAGAKIAAKPDQRLDRQIEAPLIGFRCAKRRPSTL